ncbi:MAG TPA: phosphatase domain-containing protein [Chryseosolibacter sp.]
MSLKKRFTQLAAGIEGRVDDLMFALRKRLNKTSSLQIVVYRSYGTVNRLYVKGRVLEDKGIRKASATDSLFQNVLSMYQRFESDEIPGARLSLMLQGEEHTVTTDEEGYFVINLQPRNPVEWKDMWHEVEIKLVKSELKFEGAVTATAEVLVPPTDAEYGIISDIDDTIVKTGATDLLAMSRNTFLHNAHTRLPFAGVAEFYKSLQLGRNGKRNNPFFYVSSSPWNLYDLLIDFLDLNKIPEGPLLLRDFGLDAKKAGFSDHMGHKFHEIQNILVTYPKLNFVLIGDSGQEDPKIYREVVRRFPGRILAIYIRDVQLADREKLAVEISKELLADKVEMVVVDNTVEAAKHAAENGLIFTEAIPQIIQEKRQDKGEAPGKTDMSIMP